MSTYETLLTPATYVEGDDAMRPSPEASARHRGRWKSGVRKHLSPQLIGSKGKGDGPHKVVKNKSNVIKRAIHKIGKKTKKSSSHPSLSSSSAGVDTTHPKVRFSTCNVFGALHVRYFGAIWQLPLSHSSQQPRFCFAFLQPRSCLLSTVSPSCFMHKTN